MNNNDVRKQASGSLDVEKKSNSVTMYYDSDCIACTAEAKRLQSSNPNDIRLVSVNEGLNTLKEAGFSHYDAMTYLCVQDAEGNWYTHMDAMRILYSTANKRWAPLLYLPIIKQIGDSVYPIAARNRYRFPNWFIKLIFGKDSVDICQNGVCNISTKKRMNMK